MISEMDELKQVKSNLKQLHDEAPHIYAKLEYIASLTRQLSIHYKYLGLLMFSNDSELVQENRPSLIRESVLALYEQEVEKVKAEQNFILFKNMMLNLHSVDYPQMFLIILGAEPNFVFHNNIIK